MEMKGKLVDFDNMGENSAYSLLNPGLQLRDNIHSISQRRTRSFELKTESPRGRNIQKLAKSLSDHFIINVDELTNNVNMGSFEETSSILGETLSSEIGFVSLMQDDKRLHSSSQSKKTEILVLILINYNTVYQI